MSERGWESVRQLSRRVGLSEGWIRQRLHDRQLRHAKPGGRYLIPAGAWEEFIQRNTVEADEWDGETKGRACNGSKNAAPSTYVGAKAVEAASARRVLRTAERLKSTSRTGSKDGSEAQGHVIPLKS
jgi:excisionase family DNA binding protein